jgi:hypothetical protein
MTSTTVTELVEGHLAFGVAHFLDDHLLGGLCRNPSERLDVDLETERIAELTLGIEITSRLQQKLRLFVFDDLHDGLELEEFDLAQFRVVMGLYVSVHTETLPCSRLHGRLQDFDDRVTGNVLLSVDGVDQS